MQEALVNARILIDGEFVADRAVVIEAGRIVALPAIGDLPEGVARHDLGGALLAPGFIDTQVNGGGGVLFNDEPTVDGIAAIGAAHRRFGTTGFFPTLISDDLDVIREAVAATDAAIAAGVPGVLGIHIEGPFLNRARKGIHRAEKIRTLDEEGFAVLITPERGRTLVTLAPENTTPETIRRLVADGVTVAAGHTNATYEEAIAAMDAGLSGVTHLFNAMSPLAHRAPGMVGAALERAGITCGIIVDGHHVAPTTLKLALRCKPAESFMLVTDAMPTVGSDATEFVLQGKPIFVRDGAVTDADGTLAGSNLDMASAVRNAVEMLDVDLPTAIAMASIVPATFMGVAQETGSIAVGKRADLVLLDERIEVLATWIGGTFEQVEAPAGAAILHV